MQQQLNTPEELRAIREAMDEGKNPLVATDVPRWEDQVGISRIVNRRVLEFEVLPTPAQVLGDLPLSDQAQEIVAYSRTPVVPISDVSTGRPPLSGIQRWGLSPSDISM